MKSLSKGFLLIMVIFLGLSLFTGLATGEVKLVKGQMLYLPCSTSYIVGDYSVSLEATLFIHNTDPKNSINVVSIDFYNTSGKLVEKYIQQPLKIAPLAGTCIHVKHPVTGEAGTASHFVIRWESETKIVEPLIGGLCLGSVGTRGYCFTTHPRIIQEAD